MPDEMEEADIRVRPIQRSPVQGKLPIGEAGGAANRTGLPDSLKANVERLSGLSLDRMRVNYNSPKPKALGALAYTQGEEIHVAPHQEKHLPHEAWHAVQQMQGRVKPERQLCGAALNASAELEREADVMGQQASGGMPPPQPAPTPARPAANTVASAPIQRIPVLEVGDRVVIAQSHLQGVIVAVGDTFYTVKSDSAIIGTINVLTKDVSRAPIPSSNEQPINDVVDNSDTCVLIPEEAGEQGGNAEDHVSPLVSAPADDVESTSLAQVLRVTSQQELQPDLSVIPIRSGVNSERASPHAESHILSFLDEKTIGKLAPTNWDFFTWSQVHKAARRNPFPYHHILTQNMKTRHYCPPFGPRAPSGPPVQDLLRHGATVVISSNSPFKNDVTSALAEFGVCTKTYDFKNRWSRDYAIGQGTQGSNEDALIGHPATMSIASAENYQNLIKLNPNSYSSILRTSGGATVQGSGNALRSYLATTQDARFHDPAIVLEGGNVISTIDRNQKPIYIIGLDAAAITAVYRSEQPNHHSTLRSRLHSGIDLTKANPVKNNDTNIESSSLDQEKIDEDTL